MKNAQDGMREKKESLKLFFPHPPLPSQHPAGAADLPGSAFALRGYCTFCSGWTRADFCGPGCGRPFSMRWVICWPTDDAPGSPCRCDDDRLLPAGSERILRRAQLFGWLPPGRG